MRTARLFAFALLLAGCGDPAAHFAGSWTCSSTKTFVDQFGVDTVVDNGTWTIRELGDGTVEVSEDGIPSCPPIKLQVSGDKASLEPGQTCDVSDGTIVTYVSLDATSDGKTLTMNYADSTQVGTDSYVSTCHR
jgi:hypothetical protein